MIFLHGLSELTLNNENILSRKIRDISSFMLTMFYNNKLSIREIYY
jgi:hypothetical protein